MLLLLDVHAVLDHLYLNGTQPQITAPPRIGPMSLRPGSAST
jgi:hypothetical protein